MTQRKKGSNKNQIKKESEMIWYFIFKKEQKEVFVEGYKVEGVEREQNGKNEVDKSMSIEKEKEKIRTA